jgi:hypothetical protein
MTVTNKDEALTIAEQEREKRNAHYHRLRQVNHIQSPEALFNIFDRYEVIDPDFDDEHFLNICNYSMQVTEPYRGRKGAVGNHLPKGKVKASQYTPKLLPNSENYWKRLVRGYQ